jgi:hypothetical protein
MSRRIPKAFRRWYKRLLRIERKRLCGNRIIGSKDCYREHFDEGMSPEELLALEISYADWG